MGRTRTDEFRKGAVRIALTSGLTEGQVGLDERVMTQRPRDPIPNNIYSLHAPEVECIGNGKAHKPYEFGVNASVATTHHKAINPIMAAVGYTFRLTLDWIRFLWLQIWIRWITSPSAIIA